MRPFESPGTDESLAPSGEGNHRERRGMPYSGFKKTTLGWDMRCTVGAGSFIQA